MKLKEIEKAIELANNGKIDDLKALLAYERQKEILNGDTKKTAFLTAVKAVIDNKDLKLSRPTLACIEHTPDGKPFICDGYLAVRWNVAKPELDGLPQDLGTPIAINNLINVDIADRYTVTDDDRLIIRNLAKFTKLGNDKNRTIYLFGSFFNAGYLKKLFDIIGYDITEVGKERSGYAISNLKTHHIETAESSAIICPIRVSETEKQKAIIDTTNDFLAMLKGDKE